MRMTASLAFASLVACPAAGFERIEPLEDSSTHGAFRKYTNDKGTVEYDFRYYPDGTAGGYVILPEGDSGEVTICGKTYALKAGLFGRRPGVGMTSIYSKAYTEGSDPLCRGVDADDGGSFLPLPECSSICYHSGNQENQEVVGWTS